jgi:6-phosphogluconolactonase
MPTQIEIFDGVPALAHSAAAWLARGVARAIEEREWCHLALPGGPFVRPIYAELAQFQVRWSDVTFYFTDERCVPISHPASNYGEAIDKFLKNPRIDSHQFRRIEGERPDRELAAEEYARVLPEELDVVLAELGADGHVAALYPDSPALSENERLAVAVQAPTRPQQRISVTPPVLLGAREVLVVAAGRDRKAAFARVMAPSGELASNPGRLLRERIWFVDREVGSDR